MWRTSIISVKIAKCNEWKSRCFESKEQRSPVGVHSGKAMWDSTSYGKECTSKLYTALYTPRCTWWDCLLFTTLYLVPFLMSNIHLLLNNFCEKIIYPWHYTNVTFIWFNLHVNITNHGVYTVVQCNEDNYKNTQLSNQ